MKSRLLSFCAALTLFAGLVSHGFAAEPLKKKSAKSPSIEGTYKLVARKFSDGTVLNGQEVIGLYTYTKTHRNFNLAWKDSAGKLVSHSYVSTYTLTSKQYTEKILLNIMNDESNGKGTVHTLNGSPQSVPVKIVGDRIEFKMPFEPVTSVFEGDKINCTVEGGIVDIWEKVK